MNTIGSCGICALAITEHEHWTADSEGIVHFSCHLSRKLTKSIEENDRLRTQLKSVEADAAVMREACQKGLSAIDKLMGDSDLDSDESDEMKACQLLSKSLVIHRGRI